jgi:hypothetical protein
MVLQHHQEAGALRHHILIVLHFEIPHQRILFCTMTLAHSEQLSTSPKCDAQLRMIAYS